MSFGQEVCLVLIGAAITALIGIIGYCVKRKIGILAITGHAYKNWNETIVDINVTNTKSTPVIISNLRLKYMDGQETEYSEIYDMSTKESNPVISTIDKTGSYELQPMEAKVIKCLVKISEMENRKIYLSYLENGKQREKYLYTQSI